MLLWILLILLVTLFSLYIKIFSGVWAYEDKEWRKLFEEKLKAKEEADKKLEAEKLAK